MKYIYLISHAVDYNGEEIVAVKTSKRKAIEYAENNLGGDNTIVIRYPVGWDCKGGTSYIPGDWIVAKWKCSRRTGATLHGQLKFERIK